MFLPTLNKLYMAIQCEQGIFLLHGMIDLVIEILVITLLLIKLFLIVYCLHKHSLNVLCKDSANEWNDKRKMENKKILLFMRYYNLLNLYIFINFAQVIHAHEYEKGNNRTRERAEGTA